jgi:hypothetical protein
MEDNPTGGACGGIVVKNDAGKEAQCDDRGGMPSSSVGPNNIMKTRQGDDEISDDEEEPYMTKSEFNLWSDDGSSGVLGLSLREQRSMRVKEDDTNPSCHRMEETPTGSA